jgi:hypothetical protein
MEICPRCGGQYLGCSCFVAAKANDEEMAYDLLSAVNEISELGMDLCFDSGEVPDAAFFFSSKGKYCRDIFDFKNKTETMKSIREMISAFQAQIVVLMSKLERCDIDELPPGFSTENKEIMCIYAEDKYESFGVILEYWRGDDGYIEFGEDFVFREDETIGPLTGFLNKSLRLK